MVVAAVIGTAAVGAVAGADGARRAANAQGDATRAAGAASQDQLALAREQWDYQKNTYLPKAMQQADDQLMLNKAVTANQLKDSELYRGLASDSFDQAKKSWKYQDEFMNTTDDYASGKMGNRMADEANADVEQAYGGGLKTMMRGAQRYGINPGSGEFAAEMGDMALQHSADSAGAQTNARVAARNKAEMMVATAAGSGQAGFGTGLSAGALATGAGSAASATGANSSAVLNGVSSTFGAGANGAGYNFGGSAGSALGAGRLGLNSPTADFYGGLANSAIKIGTQIGGLKMPAFNYGGGAVDTTNYTNDGYIGGGV